MTQGERDRKEIRNTLKKIDGWADFNTILEENGWHLSPSLIAQMVKEGTVARREIHGYPEYRNI